MPWFLRKSKSVGPVRFNLSKSGVGTSFGVTGARIGSGPGGAYVHMGRKGLYYRRTLSASTGSGTNRQERQVASRRPDPPILGPAPVLAEVTSASIDALVDASSDEVLADINAKRGHWFLRLFGIRPAAMLTYELDEQEQANHAALLNALATLGRSQRIWQVDAQGQQSDWKHNAGANWTVKRHDVRLSSGNAPGIAANVPIVGMALATQGLFFCPDRLLIRQRGQYAAIGYDSIRVSMSETQFREPTGIPQDAELVGRTWQFVNKSGGPDRRFKNNRQIPVARYASIGIQSASGLNVALLCSNCQSAREAAVELDASMKKSLSTGQASAT